MTNIVNVTYNRTGQSTRINPMGMRDMQALAFEYSDAQYLLLKSPPALSINIILDLIHSMF